MELQRALPLVPKEVVGKVTAGQGTAVMPFILQPVQSTWRASPWTLEYSRKGCFLTAISA